MTLLKLLSIVTLAGSAAAQVPTGFIATSGTKIIDATGVPVASATLCAQVSSGNSVPMSARAGGGGQLTKLKKCVAVTNGGFTINLPDTLLTVPTNACLAVTAKDSKTGNDLLDGSYSCVQPTSDPTSTWCSTSSGVTTCNFDLYKAPHPSLALKEIGADGLSAYQIYQAAGGTKSQADWLLSLKGADGAPGAPGEVSNAQLNTTASQTNVTTIHQLGLAPTPNLLDPSGTVFGNLRPDGTIDTTYGQEYITTGFLDVHTQQSVVSNLETVFNNSYASIFYASDKTTKVQVNQGDVAPNIAISNNNGGYYFRTSYRASEAGVVPFPYVGGGTLVPTPVPSFAITLPETTDLAREATAINAGVAGLQSFNLSRSGELYVPIFDYTATTFGVLRANGDIDTEFGTQYSVTPCMHVSGSYVIANFDIGYPNPNFATLFYAADQTTIVRSVPNLLYAAGTPIPVPPTASCMRGFGGTGAMGSLSMVVLGQTLPPYLYPFHTADPWNGKRGFVTGDSITYYSNAGYPRLIAQTLKLKQTIPLSGGQPNAYFAAIGAQKGAYSSGTTYAAGDLVYYTDNVYYLSMVGSNTGNTPSSSPTQWANWALTSDVIGQPGHTLEDIFLPFVANAAANPSGPTVVQQLATALSNKDFMLIAAGTNNYQQTLGQFGDTPVDGNSLNGNPGGAPSWYSALEFALQTAQQAIQLTGRQIRLFYLTPYHNSRGTPAAALAQINAIKQVCQEWTTVVFDAYSNLNVNSINWPTTLVYESDGNGGMMHLHPTSVGIQLLGSFVARQMGAYAQQ